MNKSTYRSIYWSEAPHTYLKRFFDWNRNFGLGGNVSVRYNFRGGFPADRLVTWLREEQKKIDDPLCRSGEIGPARAWRQSFHLGATEHKMSPLGITHLLRLV